MIDHRKINMNFMKKLTSLYFFIMQFIVFYCKHTPKIKSKYGRFRGTWLLARLLARMRRLLSF